MPTEIWCALIAGFVTLVTSIGSFQMSVRKDREKAKEELKAELIKYHEKNREEIDKIRQGDLREIRDDLSDMGANLQQKIAVIDEQIRQLSDRVEKHNQVVERVFHLEDADKLLDEKIKVANHRIEDIESVLANKR